MKTILGYELRRLLGNKLFWGLAVVTLWYAHRSLTGDVIWGIANTAPFSGWSFGYYLASVQPFVCAATLFFIGFYVSREEKDVKALTSATPVPPGMYVRIRCAAVLIGTGD